MEKDRIKNKVSDDVKSADMSLFEKMQKKIEQAQKRIDNTLNYDNKVLEKFTQAAEKHRKSLEQKKFGD